MTTTAKSKSDFDLKDFESKDRVYKLIKGTPLSYVIPSHDSKAYRLLHWDGTQNRVLRYATNHNSPFVDEQEGEVILDSIEFLDGFLSVPKENPALQILLSIFHPGLGKDYVEVNEGEDARKEMEKLDLEAEAIVAAKTLNVDQAEHMYRILFNRDPSKVSSDVMFRDIKIEARKNPSGFLSKYEDPALTIQSDVRLMFQRGVLGFRNNQSDIHYNIRDNKKRLISVPLGEDPYRRLQAFLETEEGIEVKAFLEKYMEDM